MNYIIALGNPGDEYAKNRHNTGRIILEMLSKKLELDKFKEDKKIRALVSKGVIDSKKISVVFPNNFMNNSGGSVKPLVESAKDLDKIVVVYDDIDLPLGTVRLSYNRGSGGHNGLISIIKSLKSEAFLRIRVGVSPSTAGGKIRKPESGDGVLKFLLGDFRPKEMEEMKGISKTVLLALILFVTEGREKAISEINSL